VLDQDVGLIAVTGRTRLGTVAGPAWPFLAAVP
jgi:hypothetical protein